MGTPRDPFPHSLRSTREFGQSDSLPTIFGWGFLIIIIVDYFGGVLITIIVGSFYNYSRKGPQNPIPSMGRRQSSESWSVFRTWTRRGMIACSAKEGFGFGRFRVTGVLGIRV